MFFLILSSEVYIISVMIEADQKGGSKMRKKKKRRRLGSWKYFLFSGAKHIHEIIEPYPEIRIRLYLIKCFSKYKHRHPHDT